MNGERQGGGGGESNNGRRHNNHNRFRHNNDRHRGGGDRRHGNDRHRGNDRHHGHDRHRGHGGGGQGFGEERNRSLRHDRRRIDQIRQVEKRFDGLTAIDPNQRFQLETTPDELTTRVLDLFSPIGRGQRAMIVAPPKTGKTILLQKIAHALHENHPEVAVICLLVDERPEEVTDFRRSVHAEVMASCSDQSIDEHVYTAEETFFKARSMALEGKDVVVLLDSLTRLARAFNHYTESSGKTLSGGLDSAAMVRPRRFFGAARNIDRGGSLTIVASALIETGSRMDEIIFQEFKGTGNTEIVLSRKLAEQRLFPALDLNQTGTRREERLFTPEEMRKIRMLRRALSPLSPFEAMSLILEKMKETKTNEEFLRSMAI